MVGFLRMDPGYWGYGHASGVRETLSEPQLACTHRRPDRCVSLEASGHGITVDFGFFLGLDKNISSLRTSKDGLAG